MRYGLMTILFLMIAGCVGMQSYGDQISSKPMPITAADRGQECALIRSEIARMYGMYEEMEGNPWSQMVILQTIEDLESKKASLDCNIKPKLESFK